MQQGLEETKRGYCPDIKPIEIDLDAFDTLAVGTPTWWYTMAPAVLSFFKKTNFEGKTVIPFMTNWGWPGHVIKDMTTRIEDRRGTVKHPLKFVLTVRVEAREKRHRMQSMSGLVSVLCNAVVQQSLTGSILLFQMKRM